MYNASKLLRLTKTRAALLIVILNIFCTGCGMGIPIVNIIFGFALGWYIIRWMIAHTTDRNILLKLLVRYSWMTALVTFIEMIIIWGPNTTLLFSSELEITNFGVPLILFNPRASVIGWFLLMIVISPFLQMLTTIFSGVITLTSSRNNLVNELK